MDAGGEAARRPQAVRLRPHRDADPGAGPRPGVDRHPLPLPGPLHARAHERPRRHQLHRAGGHRRRHGGGCRGRGRRFQLRSVRGRRLRHGQDRLAGVRGDGRPRRAQDRPRRRAHLHLARHPGHAGADRLPRAVRGGEAGGGRHGGGDRGRRRRGCGRGPACQAGRLSRDRRCRVAGEGGLRGRRAGSSTPPSTTNARMSRRAWGSSVRAASTSTGTTWEER